ncbi:MAG: hypothetical protein H0W76_08585 [Pyrinomonadaceae bacterium]|nr:hypothetical protein [Pyrinomonadaceae bacterium]
MVTNAQKRHDLIRKWFFLTLALWAALVALGGYAGWFTRIPVVGIAPLVLAGIALPVALYYSNKPFREFIRAIDLKYLTIFHLWRIPAGLVFLYYGNLNLLPDEFVSKAAPGDILVGLLVPVVLLLRGGRLKYLVFHVFSLLDFILAVGTGITLTVLRVPLIENLATFPVVLIPLFGVCVTGALSIMTLDRLLRVDKTRANASPNAVRHASGVTAR